MKGHEHLFDQFKQAAAFARAHAMTYGRPVSVSRRDLRWLASSSRSASCFCMEGNDDDGSDGLYDEEARLERYDSEIDELTSELSSTQDDAERSDEDGWCYED